jgi:N-acetylneuraminic acid mutarotase
VDVNPQASAHRYVAATGQFVPAGTLAQARQWHTASRLPDGRVLVAGGHTPASYSATTELYDPAKPAASAWSAGPDLLYAASQHTATVLADGRVLVAGGWGNGIASEPFLQLYDPKQNAWQVAFAMLGETRRGHTATLLKNGKVLFAGGVDGGSSDPSNWTYRESLEVYDPQSGSVKLLAAKLSMGRYAHSADLLADGRVLYVGGYCDVKCSPTAKQVDDLYDPATDAITPLPHHGELPSGHASALLADGRLLVIGGYLTDPTTVVAFQPASPPGWAKLPGLTSGRSWAEAIRLQDDTILVVGGFVPYTDQLTTAERFFP